MCVCAGVGVEDRGESKEVQLCDEQPEIVETASHAFQCQLSRSVAA